MRKRRGAPEARPGSKKRRGAPEARQGSKRGEERRGRDRDQRRGEERRRRDRDQRRGEERRRRDRDQRRGEERRRRERDQRRGEERRRRDRDQRRGEERRRRDRDQRRGEERRRRERDQKHLERRPPHPALFRARRRLHWRLRDFPRPDRHQQKPGGGRADPRAGTAPPHPLRRCRPGHPMGHRVAHGLFPLARFFFAAEPILVEVRLRDCPHGDGRRDSHDGGAGAARRRRSDRRLSGPSSRSAGYLSSAGLRQPSSSSPSSLR